MTVCDVEAMSIALSGIITGAALVILITIIVVFSNKGE